MAQKALILSSLTFMLIALGCTPPITSAPQPAASPEVEVDPGFNILIAAEGEVRLKRAAWSDFYPTAFGAILQRGDLLQLAGGARATILCDGLTMWQVPAGAPAGLTNGCPPPSDKILVRGTIGIASSQRGTNDPLIPYIISPRATKLLDNTPTLRWNDSGAASYRVQVRGGNLNWQQEDVTQTELVYPGAPALKPGEFYLLVVRDSEGRSSQDEGLKGLGFSLLEEAEAGRVQAEASRIAGLGLSGEAETFALAQLYAGRGLVAEAIEILEGLIEEGSRQAAVHQALADLYAQIDLALLAEPRYLEAVHLAEAGGNVEGVAVVQARLGEVYITLNNIDEAIRWLTQAQAGYETLGDIQRASQLAGRIAELNK